MAEVGFYGNFLFINEVLLDACLENISEFFEKIALHWLNQMNKSELLNILNNPQFKHILKYLPLNICNQSLFSILICEFPEVFKNHFNILAQINDFSFLISKTAVILFEDRNHLNTPFSLKVLVSTVRLDTLIALLELWEYELKEKDARMVLYLWSNNAEFLKFIKKDSRSWLLSDAKFFRDIYLFKVSNFQIAPCANLLIAYLYHSELVIFKSLLNLEIIYSNLKGEKSKLISDFKTLGNHDTAIIKSHLCCKDRIITNLTKIYDKLEIGCDDRTLINYFLILFKVPLIYLNRHAFIEFHNKAHVSNQSNDDKNDLRKFVNNRINSLLFKLYDEKITNEFVKVENLIFLLIGINQILSKNRRKIFWHIPLTMLIIKTSNNNNNQESDFYFKTLILFLKEQSFDLNLQSLAPESVGKFSRFIEFFDDKLEMFKLAPESLKRDQIKYLLRNPQLWEFMFMHASNFQKLCTLVDFNANDLLQFFPVYHLELHEALYTARSTAQLVI